MATRRPVRPAPADAWGPLPPHATRPARSPLIRWTERTLLGIGVLCLGYYAYASAETVLYQAYENRELDAILSSREPSRAADTVRPSRAVAPGDTVGRIEIPRLGVSAVIKAGADARTLRLAVGHIPGTALPGERGNVGLAGHRDTFFRRLRDVRPDDEIRVRTPERMYSYRVERTDVVEPRDVWVLDPTEYSALTLVTCYPFTYVGSAPQRFIVRAQLLARPETGTAGRKRAAPF
jgi:sortase A